MTIKYTALFLLVISALISDIKLYKIKNIIVLFFIFTGIAINYFIGGYPAVLSAVCGIVVPILIFITLFALRMLGAGDIKLFSAIGALMGLKFVLATMVYSFLAGGVVALVLMLLRKNGFQRIKYLFLYIKSCILSFSLLSYTDFDDKSDGAKFHFAIAIALGVGMNILWGRMHIIGCK